MSAINNINNLISNQSVQTNQRIGNAYNNIKTLDIQNDNCAIANEDFSLTKLPIVIRTEDGKLHVFDKRAQEYFPYIAPISSIK